VSELAVGSLAGLAANSYVIDVASGSQLTQPGMVLQVVSTTKTDTFSASVSAGGWTDVTDLSLSITPSSTANKILVSANVHGSVFYNSNGTTRLSTRLLRDATVIGNADSASNRFVTHSSFQGEGSFAVPMAIANVNFLDAPNSTATITYKVQAGNGTDQTSTLYINATSGDATDNIFRWRTVSTITLMEIAG